MTSGTLATTKTLRMRIIEVTCDIIDDYVGDEVDSLSRLLLMHLMQVALLLRSRQGQATGARSGTLRQDHRWHRGHGRDGGSGGGGRRRRGRFREGARRRHDAAGIVVEDRRGCLTPADPCPRSHSGLRVSRRIDRQTDKRTGKIPSTSPARCSCEHTHFFSTEEHLHSFTCSFGLSPSLSLFLSLCFCPAAVRVPYLFFHAHSLSLSLFPSLPPSHPPPTFLSLTRFPSRALLSFPLSYSHASRHSSPSLSRTRHELSPSLSLSPSLLTTTHPARAPVGAPCPRVYRNYTTATVNSLARSGRSLCPCLLIRLSLSVSLSFSPVRLVNRTSVYRGTAASRAHAHSTLYRGKERR